MCRYDSIEAAEDLGLVEDDRTEDLRPRLNSLLEKIGAYERAQAAAYGGDLR